MSIFLTTKYFKTAGLSVLLLLVIKTFCSLFFLSQVVHLFSYTPHTHIKNAMAESPTSIPIVNFQQVLEERSELLLAACREHGFFYLTNHGVEETLVKEVFRQSQLFFSQSLEEKNSVLADSNGRGYTRMGEETLDPKNQKTGDTKEGYYIGREETVDTHLPLHGRNQWPDAAKLPNWKEKMVFSLWN